MICLGVSRYHPAAAGWDRIATADTRPILVGAHRHIALYWVFFSFIHLGDYIQLYTTNI